MSANFDFNFAKLRYLLKLKKPVYIIWLSILFALLSYGLNAQQKQIEIKPILKPINHSQISLPISKGMTLPRPDRIILSDSTLTTLADSTKKDALTKGDIETTVEYMAEDSTIMDVVNKEVHLYGKAQVKYGKIQLTANYIKLNWTLNELFAIGTFDSTSKKTEGQPVFQDGGESYTTDEIRYNFKSKKGIIRGVITQQGEGFIHGTKVKRDAEGNAYMMGNMYTTCNLEHPHFYINSRKIKLVNNKQIISGLFNIVVNDVPLPLGLPFGFFPLPKNKESGTSGIIFPQYGEEPNGRGFYLRNGGYYFAISEYVNAVVTGQIYSTGSWGLGVGSTYSSRYRYNGNFSFNYNRNFSGDEIDKLLNRDARNDFSLSWSHNPKARGSSTFSANVNISSNSFNNFNAESTQKYISNVASSSVQYNKSFGQLARAGASLRVNQNFGDLNQQTGRRSGGKTDVSTDFSFGISQFAPLAFNGATGRWYESFRLGFDFSGSYGFTNVLSRIDTSYSTLRFKIANNVDSARARGDVVLPFNGHNLSPILGDAKFNGRYSIPISLPNFKILKYINFTPGIGLQGEVFTKQFAYTYLGENTIRIDTLNQLGTEYSYSFSAGMNTRFYGMFHSRLGRLEAIRHTVVPSVSFSYTPDFTSDQFNFYQKVQIDDKGTERTFSRFRGINNTGGNGRASGVVSFGLTNMLEMKLKSKSDTAATQSTKVSLLDNFGINGSYNLIADSLNLSNISVNANTRLGKNLNFNFNMNFDPYIYIKDPEYPSNTTGIRVSRYAIANGQGLAKLQNINMSLSTSFSPGQKKKNTPQNVQKTGLPSEQLEAIDRNPQMYIDFEMPWSINLSYNFGWNKTGFAASNVVQAITFNGDLSLTPKWKVSVNSGFDFAALKPSITQLNIHRDLHCWDMSLSWTPFAGSAIRASNYNFTIKARSSILQDLKLTRRRSFYDSGGY